MQIKRALALMVIASMLLTAVPIFAWEYSNTNLGPDGWYRYKSSDDLVQPYGPRVDKLAIIMYANELAEFTALEMGQIDLTDWPVDTTHFVPWTTSPLNSTVAVIDTGPEFGMFILDMNNNPNAQLPDGNPNPAYIAGIGNPMADVDLRHAIAHCVNRTDIIYNIVSGGSTPLLGSEMYTPCGEAYGDWQHPEIKPGGAREDLTHPFNITEANAILNASGYLPIVGGYRTYGGTAFQLKFVIRQDDINRQLFGQQLYTILTNPLPGGLALNVNLNYRTSAGAKVQVMADKNFHMYTGGWNLGVDPDHLYYLFNINQYWHPGRPPNYSYYGGSEAANNNGNVSDYGWGLMTSLTYAQALDQAWKCQKAIAQRVQGVPLWCSASYTAFKRTYAGTPGTPGDAEDVYEGKPWKGIANQRGLGVWGWWSQYNMHPVNETTGQPLPRNGDMTLRWGFSQPTMSLNPIYAEWVWDWNVLGRSYDSLIGLHPYTLADMRSLANNWEIDTWDASSLGLGTCTKVTFNLRHDAYWSDGVQLTSSDVKFSWGGPRVTGSISNLLAARGAPPPWWAGQVADILSISTPDPFTVIVHLDIFSYFGFHSMSGWNIVLPEHVWKPLIQNYAYSIEAPWGQPNVASGPFIITDTSDPAARRYVMLEANKKHYELDRPVNVWTYQLPTTYTIPSPFGTYESIGQLHPLTTAEKANVSINVYIHNKYFYETGPYNATASEEKIFPRTVLDGTKSVSLWEWNKVGKPSDITKYIKVSDRLVNEPWESEFCVPDVETVWLGNMTAGNKKGTGLNAGFYIVKIDVHIDSLKYYNKTLSSWVIVPPASNPWYSKTITYREFIIVTALADICGAYWKTVGGQNYQAIPDLKVDSTDSNAVMAAFGSMPGDPRWNPQADLDRDDFISLVDPWITANMFGWVACTGVPWGYKVIVHDVATIGIKPSSTNITLGQSVNINVTVKNQGDATETFIEDVFLSVYANTTFLGSQTVSSLIPAATRTLTFSWNTTGFLTGPYKITAIAQKVPGETDTRDNDLSYGIVLVQTGNMHLLDVFNSPGLSTLLPFTINNTRNVSPWLGQLDEDTYVIAVPQTIADHGIIYNFKNWEDTTTSPTRTIVLDKDAYITAYYEVSSTSLPLVYVSPIVIGASPDTSFPVNVTIANVTNLYTWEFKLYYDTRFLNSISVAEGSFLKAGGTTTFQIKALDDAYNSTHGLVWLNCSLLGPPYGVNGSGLLATITFEGVASGNSILSLSETRLSDRYWAPISHETLQGVGLVRIRMVEDVTNDGMVDMVDMWEVARRFGRNYPDPFYSPHMDIDGTIDGRPDGKIDMVDMWRVARLFGWIDP